MAYRDANCIFVNVKDDEAVVVDFYGQTLCRHFTKDEHDDYLGEARAFAIRQAQRLGLSWYELN